MIIKEDHGVYLFLRYLCNIVNLQPTALRKSIRSATFAFSVSDVFFFLFKNLPTARTIFQAANDQSYLGSDSGPS